MPVFWGAFMLTRLYFAVLFCVALNISARSQEDVGPLETFGTEGRPFSTGRNDYYLLSRQHHLNEDFNGYDGRVRKIKRFEGGGYEIELKEFVIQCSSPAHPDMTSYVIWYDDGQKDISEGYQVDIRNPTKFPGEGKKDSYNLYWAACHKQFRKFK
jgi:hypothetical protein